MIPVAKPWRRAGDPVTRSAFDEGMRVLVLSLLLLAGCAAEEPVERSERAPLDVDPAASVAEPAPAPRSVAEPLPLYGPPVPAIDAKVAAFRDDPPPGLVLLTVGSDDKVEKGFQFSIYRGAVFVGKVVVEKVLKDSCGCRVLFVKEGERIQVGDAAATRLQ